MDEDRHERTRETNHTTVVTTDRGGSGAGTVIAVLLGIVLIGLLLLLAFGGWLGGATDDIDVPEEVGVNVDVDSDSMQMPDLEAPEPDAPAGDQGGNSS